MVDFLRRQLEDPYVLVSIAMGAFSFALFWRRNHKHIHDMEDVFVKAAGLGLLVGFVVYFGLVFVKVILDSFLL